MTTATDGLGSIIAGLEDGGGGGGGGLLEEDFVGNVRMVRGSDATNGTFDENAQYCTMFGTGNSEGSTLAGIYSVIGGGDSNVISADWGTVSGGRFNFLASYADEGGEHRLEDMTIGGGRGNFIQQKSGTIAGGLQNGIGSPNPLDEDGFGSAVGGGYQNVINGFYGVISGGKANKNGDMGIAVNFGTIAGGTNNVVHADRSTISGGGDNSINDAYGTIGGGQTNQIFAFDNTNSGYQTISGGYNNSSGGRANVIAGGFQHQIGTPTEGGDSWYSNISGGYGNVIDRTVTGSVITGGQGNSILTGANYGHVSGGQANTVVKFGGSSSGIGAVSRMVTQAAFAGSQYSYETPGYRQTSEFVFRGNTSGGLNEVVLLMAGGDGEFPTVTFFEMESDKSYAFTADCVARSQPDGFSLFAQVRGLVHMDGTTPGFFGGPNPPDISANAPPEWAFFFDLDEGGFALKFTVGSNSNVVACTASVRMTEVGPYSPNP